MRTLAIDCATEACSIALFGDGALLAADHRLLGRGHAELLVPMIAALPERGEAERILVSLGPGSFTGVRIGIAAARALGFAWGAQVRGYPTLALVAAMALERGDAERVGVAMNGGHGEWLVQRFGADGSPLGEPASLVPDDAGRALGDCELVAGSRAEELIAARGRGRALVLLPDARYVPLLSAGLLGETLAPVYGRPPDARLPR